jgi:hypothetical protein
VCTARSPGVQHTGHPAGRCDMARRALLPCCALLLACCQRCCADVFITVRVLVAMPCHRGFAKPGVAELHIFLPTRTGTQTRSYNLDPLSSLEADFGPEIPEEGVSGVLKVRAGSCSSCTTAAATEASDCCGFLHGFLHGMQTARPEDACSPLDFTDFDKPWVALIARQQQFHPSLNCTFDVKASCVARGAGGPWQHTVTSVCVQCTYVTRCCTPPARRFAMLRLQAHWQP